MGSLLGWSREILAADLSRISLLDPVLRDMASHTEGTGWLAKANNPKSKIFLNKWSLTCQRGIYCCIFFKEAELTENTDFSKKVYL